MSVSFLDPTTTISTTTSTEETKVEITPPSAISVSASINLNNDQMNSDIATSTESKPAGPEAVAAPVGTTEKPVEPVAPEGDVQVTTITVTQGYILISLLSIVFIYCLGETNLINSKFAKMMRSLP